MCFVFALLYGLSTLSFFYVFTKTKYAVYLSQKTFIKVIALSLHFRLSGLRARYSSE